MIKYRRLIITLITLLTLFTLSSCKQNKNVVVDDSSMEPTYTEVVAVLSPTEGSNVSGTVIFKKVDNGIKITANVQGLEPGKHGFHIHEFGDIRKSDGTSAGGHFNPENVDHGAPTDKIRHVGDLGNIIADENGMATYERVDSVITFSGEHSIIGRGIIIHSGEDDLKSQPTGAAGSRLAMGVIGVANPNYNDKM